MKENMVLHLFSKIRSFILPVTVLQEVIELDKEGKDLLLGTAFPKTELQFEGFDFISNFKYIFPFFLDEQVQLVGGLKNWSYVM